MAADRSRHRVVVTGLGCVSAIGGTVVDFWRSLCDGRCGIGPITKVPCDNLDIRVAAEVKDFDAGRHFDRRQLNLLDPFAQYAVVAAREAIADSGLSFSPDLGRHTAVVLGTGKGGDTTANDGAYRLLVAHKPRVNPLTIPRAMANAAVSHVAIEHGITGPAFAVSSACASANHAIGQAFWMVRHGVATTAVTGGSEACLTFGTLKAWEAMRVTAPDTCRPFSRDRKGMVLGEGAGIVILESLEAARTRGASILAEVAGFGMSADANDIVHPSVDGTARAMRAALEDARLAPEAVDYVNAHGSGTKANDATETRALHSVFGAHAGKLAVSSTKSMHGHAMGAAGALELVATVLAIHDGTAPPTANFSDPDPDCDLDYLPNQAREMPVRAAISNSFAFGGLNAVLALRKFA
jgi:nodulation protein E